MDAPGVFFQHLDAPLIELFKKGENSSMRTYNIETGNNRRLRHRPWSVVHGPLQKDWMTAVMSAI